MMMWTKLVLLSLALTFGKLSEGKKHLNVTAAKKPFNAYEDAVFVALRRDMDTTSNPLKFDHVPIDVQGSFDRRAGLFYSETAGHYWVSISAGAKPKQRVRYHLYQGSSLVSSIYRDVQSHLGNETTSRDHVIKMSQMQTLSISNQQKLFSDQGLQSSLAIFRLTDLMNTSISFYAYRTSDLRVSSRQNIVFDIIGVNEGNAFGGTYFTAPKRGHYFLSFNIGMQSGSYKYDVSLQRRFSTLGVLERTTTYANDWDLISRGGLYLLEKGQRVHLRSNVASNLRSSRSYRETAFSGFLYEPKHAQKRAWHVAKTSSWTGTDPLSPVPFEEVLVDLHGDWSRKGNFFTASVGGIYYINVVVGAPVSTAVDITLLVDEEEKASVVNTSRNRNGLDIVSRSALLHIKKGSIVYLRAERHTGIHSSHEHHTTFTGLLLFAKD